MNNEDKILELLSAMQNQISDMDSKMQKKMNEIDNKMDTLSDLIVKVEVHLENITDKNIGLMMEQYNPNVEKLDDVINKVDEIQLDLGGIKRVVISHSKDINNLLKK